MFQYIFRAINSDSIITYNQVSCSGRSYIQCVDARNRLYHLPWHHNVQGVWGGHWKLNECHHRIILEVVCVCSLRQTATFVHEICWDNLGQYVIYRVNGLINHWLSKRFVEQSNSYPIREDLYAFIYIGIILTTNYL